MGVVRALGADSFAFSGLAMSCGTVVRAGFAVEVGVAVGENCGVGVGDIGAKTAPAGRNCGPGLSRSVGSCGLIRMLQISSARSKARIMVKNKTPRLKRRQRRLWGS